MTKKGIVYLPMTMYCPDRWRYAFDGQTLEVIEEFDEIPEEGLEMGIKVLGQLGYEVKQEGNNLSFSRELPQGEAIEFCLAEFLGQATISGLISRETAVHIFEEAAKAKKPDKILSTIPLLSKEP